MKYVNDGFADALNHYAQCRIVAQIYVIWSEQSNPPIDMTTKFSNMIQPKIIFHKQDVDSLNTRFKPLPSPHEDAIFSVDDDMRVP